MYIYIYTQVHDWTARNIVSKEYIFTISSGCYIVSNYLYHSMLHLDYNHTLMQAFTMASYAYVTTLLLLLSIMDMV